MMHVTEAPAEVASLAWAHPLGREWFTSKFGTPTEPQELGWPAILAGEGTLISAPTGSGKTLAACLVAIDQLLRKAITGALGHCPEILYISPFKHSQMTCGKIWKRRCERFSNSHSNAATY